MPVLDDIGGGRALRRCIAELQKGGRDVIVKELEAQSITVAADIWTDAGQLDFSGPVLKAKQSNADTLFVYGDGPFGLRRVAPTFNHEAAGHD